MQDNEEIKTLISKVWSENKHLSVASRISNCRHAISKWSKTHYINSQKLITELKRQLEVAMSDPLRKKLSSFP